DFRIPDAHGIVSRRRQHLFSVTAELRGPHNVGMALKDGDLPAALHIPDARGLVLRRRHHPLAIRAEGRAIHGVGMAFQDGYLLSALLSPWRSPHSRCVRWCPTLPSPLSCRRG